MRIIRFLVGLVLWTVGLSFMGVQDVPFYRWMSGGAMLGLAFVVWDGNHRKSNAGSEGLTRRKRRREGEDRG